MSGAERKPVPVSEGAEFAGFLELSPEALVIINQAGTIVYVNRQTEAMFGYARQELLGRTIEILVPTRDRERHIQDRDGFLADPHLRPFHSGLEVFGQRKNDQKFPVEIGLSPMRRGDELFVLSTIRDISERRRIERDLAESEERFRLLLNGVKDYALFMLDPNGRIASWNAGAEAIFGYTTNEVLGQHFSRIHPPESIAQGRPDQELTSAATTGRSEDEGWRVRKDGQRLWVNTVVTPLRSDQGRLRGFAKVTRDITERKQAEEEREHLLRQLAAERSWLRTVIDCSPTGILLFEGPEGAHVSGNRRAEDLLGRSIRPDGGFEQFMDLIAGPDGESLPAPQSAIRRALAGESVTSEERLIRRSDGRIVPILVSAGPIKDAEGKILGAVLAFEDTSVLKDFEQRREEWISVIAHDLRQPVTVIDGYASMLSRSADQPADRTRLWIGRIRQSATRLQRMIGDLLDVSRIEARRFELIRKEIDLVQLAREVSDQVMAAAPDHPIRLETDERQLLLVADAARLEQVLMNLLSNAVKYGYPNTEVRVSVARVAGEARVSVSNWGDGIAPDELPTLFARFKRTHQAQEKQVRGIGLGLYIAKGLVEAHGGRIWAESTPGQTTVFHFTLPVMSPSTPR